MVRRWISRPANNTVHARKRIVVRGIEGKNHNPRGTRVNVGGSSRVFIREVVYSWIQSWIIPWLAHTREKPLSLSSSLSCFPPWVSILRARLIIDGGSFGGKLINRAGFYFARHSWLEKGTLLRLLLNSERWFCSCKKWKLDKSLEWNFCYQQLLLLFNLPRIMNNE